MNESEGPGRDHIAAFMVYRYVGPGYLMGVPARDLWPADLLEIGDREGITREVVETSGIYERVDSPEVLPFCGAEIEDGQRCPEQVDTWGQRCPQHSEEVENVF